MKNMMIEVLAEVKRFDAEVDVEVWPFRVAVSCNFNGGDYWYGSHTEVREYADSTIGYAYTRKEALKLLIEAARDCAATNEYYRK